MKSRIDRLSKGENLLDQYPYDVNDSIREELIEEVVDSENNTIAAITRNNYGALVLNTAGVMFIDVDLPAIPVQPKGLSAVFSRLFGGSAQSAVTEDSLREACLNKFINYHRQHPNTAFRVYATKNGYRITMLHDTFDPLDSNSETILNALESDTLYKNLCKNQQCYRARLTPKPWRIDSKGPPSRFPREELKEQKRFKDWLNQYESKSKSYSVCKLVAEQGSVTMSEEVRLIVDLHDKYVVDDDKPLA